MREVRSLERCLREVAERTDKQVWSHISPADSAKDADTWRDLQSQEWHKYHVVFLLFLLIFYLNISGKIRWCAVPYTAAILCSVSFSIKIKFGLEEILSKMRGILRTCPSLIGFEGKI